MGDARNAGDEVKSPREVTVLVTGYGPFIKDCPTNASWSIASTLPSLLPPTAAQPVAIRIVVPPEALRTAYSHVADAVPNLLSQEKEYDMVLHLGLAASRTFYTLERQSFREPYWEFDDVDGETFSKERTEQLWSGCPTILKPTFDCEDVWRRWRSNVPADVDVRPSDDPGNFLCGFVYYLSMSLYWKKQCAERPVMFLHVPECPREEDIAVGRTVAIELIRALVDSRERLGLFDPLKPGAVDSIDYVMGGAEIGLPAATERWSGK